MCVCSQDRELRIKLFSYANEADYLHVLWLAAVIEQSPSGPSALWEFTQSEAEV